MDSAKTLIRSVVRAFYETKHVLVIDALLIHSALPVEDLAFLLGMQPKDLRKLCGKLKEDRLLTVDSRPEIRDGMMRPIHKDYYFIDFHATIDAIKYRMYYLTEKVKSLYKPTTEKKDFFCPQCSAQWTQMEVLDKVGPFGFECHRCGGTLERQEQKEGDATGHEKQRLLMSQLSSFIKLLQRIDAEDIPSQDFASALAAAVPVPRESTVNPLRPYQPAEKDAASMAVKGMTPTIVNLDVSVTTTSERTAAEQAEEAKRKASLAAQNALPVWHTKSTVSGEAIGQKDGEQQGPANLKTEEQGEAGEDGKQNNVLNDELTAYYAQLAREKEKEAQEEQEEDDTSGDEDDEDDFEDVDVGTSNDASPTKAHANGNSNLLSGTSSKPSESDSSAPVTSVSTPAQAANGTSSPAAKRVKFDDTPKESSQSNLAPEKDSDEDEDIEFEDV